MRLSSLTKLKIFQTPHLGQTKSKVIFKITIDERTILFYQEKIKIPNPKHQPLTKYKENDPRGGL